MSELIHLESGKKFYFTDFAGFLDTSGDFIDIINSFIAKNIFMQARSVRFLAPITYQQMLSNRGMEVREQMQLFETMYSAELGSLD